jgi:hypothetical protein
MPGVVDWLKRKMLRQEPLTVDYVNVPKTITASILAKRPPFSLTWADLMMYDNQVYFGYCVGNAPLMSAEVEVTGPDPTVCRFVQEQWEKIWSTSASKLLKAKCYGFSGYEVMHKLDDTSGRIVFDELLDRHPVDTRPLLKGSQMIGVSVNHLNGVAQQGRGKAYLVGPQGLWLTYRAQHGSRFGDPLLEHAYGPWYDKAMDNGAYDLRRLRNVKDAWIGDVVRYPMFRKLTKPDGTVISARDYAREVGESRYSGAVVALPSDRDDKGNLLFEYVPPAAIAETAQIQDWIRDLDWDIFDGLLVPREVVEAAETGSGFSGRSFPFMAFLATRDEEMGGIVRQVDRQQLRPMTAVNYGVKAAQRYQIKPRPLLETVGKQMGDMGQPNAQSQAQPQQPGQLPGRQPLQLGGPRPPHPSQQPQQYSLGDTIDAAAREVDTDPSAAQQLAGNYRHAHVTVQGLPISIETPKGASRRPQWPPLANHYGYIKRTQSEADGDHIDVFLGPNPESELVFVVDQVRGDTGTFDEHKVMIGWTDQESARQGYLSNYSPGWRGLGIITPLTMAQFKSWLDRGDSSLPMAEQAGALQFSTATAEGRWITIGGREQGGKKHVGGFPVQISADGTILKSGGLQSLVGKKLGQLKRHFSALKKKREKELTSFDPSEWEPKKRQLNQQSRVGSAITDAAAKHGVDPSDLADAVDFVWKEKRDAILEREHAKKQARDLTGLTRDRINKWEDAGKDYSTWPGLDATAREVAGAYPELGLGRGYESGANHDRTDYAAKVWELLKEGRLEPPAKHDPELIDEAAGYVLANRVDDDVLAEFDPLPFSVDFDPEKHPRDDEGKFIEVTGTEFGETDPEMLANAKEFFKTQLQGKEFVNQHTGKVIKVSGKSLKKAVSHLPDKAPVKALAKLPEIIASARYDSSQLPAGDEQNVRMYHYFEADVRLAGVASLSRIKVREDNNGNWFYDQHITAKKEDPSLSRSASPKGQTGPADESSTPIIAGQSTSVNENQAEPDKPTQFSIGGDSLADRNEVLAAANAASRDLHDHVGRRLDTLLKKKSPSKS